MNSRITTIIILVVLIGGGFWLLSPKSASTTPAPATTVTPADTQPATATTTSHTASTTETIITVTYTDKGFSPSPITVKKGQSVTFINKSSHRMWVAVDEHPTHLLYDGTSKSQHCPDISGNAFDQCIAGDSYTFTFKKTGSWEYHNHTLASDEGIVTVTQ